ncbi:MULTISPECIES: formate/nitrite transporter family protein [Haloferax]|uniref:Formate/nitrite transporter family protein n=1 Tax=Haloferax marinum TaxID=2666143 RepID=A0A6A8G8M9_9EURY|nr:MULTISPECIES: formate/nitrite transporter family protein [Haloferax]KAB1197858.1 formate/nitrite transporter family protein [Haloferax sp. CBA1150]MRW96922.1 formate/nitrite transporter family protein [Haloferax marinum]
MSLPPHQSVNGTDSGTQPGRARSGAPAAGEAVGDRFSTDEIFQRVVATADEEVESGTLKLYLSGLAAGFAITLTFFLYATGRAAFPNDATGLLAPLLYPLGFVYIIMGRYQLYTENTLTPVTLVLTRVASIPSLLRVWVSVLAGNLTGALVGTFVLASSGVFSPAAADAAVGIGIQGIETPWWDLVFKAMFAGWLVAGLVWLEHAVRDSISRVVLIYLVIYAIPASGLYHIVVSSADVFYLVFTGNVALTTGLWEFVVPVLLGNTIGGVFLVTLINYGQTENRFPESEGPRARLSLSDWLFSREISKPGE